MDKTRIIDLPAPEMKDRAAFEVIGLGADCTFEATGAIRPLWQGLNAREEEIDALPGAAACGLCLGADEAGRLRYVAGLEAVKGAGFRALRPPVRSRNRAR
jgi:AraC family transcriptional regulator